MFTHISIQLGLGPHNKLLTLTNEDKMYSMFGLWPLLNEYNAIFNISKHENYIHNVKQGSGDAFFHTNAQWPEWRHWISHRL